ncbi:UNVERIFIED_CONTAM: hypothetical protein K2H54_031561 [Gekko kuhli]
MYVPEQVLSVPEELEAASMDLYMSAAELRPTESLPLEFSDDLDVVGDGMQCPPSPLLADASAAIENQLNKNVAETPKHMHSREESFQQGLLNQVSQPVRGSFSRKTTSALESPPEPLSEHLVTSESAQEEGEKEEPATNGNSEPSPFS